MPRCCGNSWHPIQVWLCPEEGKGPIFLFLCLESEESFPRSPQQTSLIIHSHIMELAGLFDTVGSLQEVPPKPPRTAPPSLSPHLTVSGKTKEGPPWSCLGSSCPTRMQDETTQMGKWPSPTPILPSQLHSVNS